jgi:hypothetical protein
LERGLLDAAHGVDDLQLITRRKKKTTKNTADEDSEAEDSDEKDAQMEDVSVETEQQFMRRINLYVAVHLARAGPTGKRDDYKDALVYQARKEALHEFLKAAMLKSCQNNDCRL